MQSGAKDHFHGLEIQLASLLTLGKDAIEQPVYFVRDLSLDLRGRFFLWRQCVLDRA